MGCTDRHPGQTGDLGATGKRDGRQPPLLPGSAALREQLVDPRVDEPGGRLPHPSSLQLLASGGERSAHRSEPGLHLRSRAGAPLCDIAKGCLRRVQLVLDLLVASCGCAELVGRVRLTHRHPLAQLGEGVIRCAGGRLGLCQPLAQVLRLPAAEQSGEVDLDLRHPSGGLQGEDGGRRISGSSERGGVSGVVAGAATARARHALATGEGRHGHIVPRQAGPLPAQPARPQRKGDRGA